MENYYLRLSAYHLPRLGRLCGRGGPDRQTRNQIIYIPIYMQIRVTKPRRHIYLRLDVDTDAVQLMYVGGGSYICTYLHTGGEKRDPGALDEVPKIRQGEPVGRVGICVLLRAAMREISLAI